MALSDDQRAMLRLLAQREQGYEDIAALMGLSVGEVRAKVREALEQLDEANGSIEEAPVVAAAKVEQPPPPPEKEPPPERVAKGVPVEPPKPPAPASAPARSRATPLSRVSLPADRGRLAAVAAGAGALVLLIVLLVTGTFSSDGSSKPSSSSGTTTTASNAASSQLTQAVLEPVNGGGAQGRALFGRVRKTAVLEVIARGLEPSPAGHSYTVWLYRSPKVVLRIGGVRVPKSGGISAQFPLPAQLLAYVASGAFDQIDISLTPDAAYKAEVAQAKRQKRLPRYTGVDVLRGKITGPAIKSASGN